MLKSVPYLAALLFAVLLISVSAHADTQTGTAVARAVADPRRPPEQVSLDATRKPAQLIAFAQLKRGDRILDFMPGNAYFTRIMSDVAGDTGHVYAFLPTEQLQNCSAQEVAGTRLLEHAPPNRCTELIHCACGMKLQRPVLYSMPRATCCATPPTIKGVGVRPQFARPNRSGRLSIPQARVKASADWHETCLSYLPMLYLSVRTRFRSLVAATGGKVWPLPAGRGRLLPLDTDSSSRG